MGAHFQQQLFTGGVQEKLVNVVAAVEFAAVYCQQVIPRLYIDSRLGQRSAKMRIPVFSAVDFGESVTAVFHAVVGAQQSHTNRRHLGDIATLGKHVPHGEFAQHLAKEIIQVFAADDSGKEGAVLFFGSGDVEPVVILR